MKKHGESGANKTPEYAAWRSMIERCYRRKCRKYRRYGQRGIRVCPQWRWDFECFLADMGRRPSPLHTLDRKDNDGHYNKKNCRWVTQQVQARNRSTNRVVVFRGRRMILIEACERAGIGYGVVKSRLWIGWTVQRALSVPAREKRLAA